MPIDPKKILLSVNNLKVYFPITKGLFLKKTGDIKAVDDISFNISDNTSNVLFVNSIYSDIDSNDLNFTLSVNDNFNLGDFNYDNSVDVIDVIILVNYIMSSAKVELEGGDINGDNEINILDVTFLINIILN